MIVVVIVFLLVQSCSDYSVSKCSPSIAIRNHAVRPDKSKRPAGRIPDHTYVANMKCETT